MLVNTFTKPCGTNASAAVVSFSVTGSGSAREQGGHAEADQQTRGDEQPQHAGGGVSRNMPTVMMAIADDVDGA